MTSLVDQNGDSIFNFMIDLFSESVPCDFTTVILNSQCYEGRGLFLNEIMEIKILSFPTEYRLNGTTSPSVNGDFPKGVFVTPRHNATRWISPYINQVQFIVPLSPDITDQFENHEFDENGVLRVYKGVVSNDTEQISYTLTRTDLLDNKSDDKINFIGIELIFLSLIIIILPKEFVLRKLEESSNF